MDTTTRQLSAGGSFHACNRTEHHGKTIQTKKYAEKRRSELCQITVFLTPEQKNTLNESLSKTGMTQQAWIETVILDRLKKLRRKPYAIKGATALSCILGAFCLSNLTHTGTKTDKTEQQTSAAGNASQTAPIDEKSSPATEKTKIKLTLPTGSVRFKK